ncbi:hypothetical protein V6C27_02125 [Peptococcaceae bacterium 1198_IL3148]
MKKLVNGLGVVVITLLILSLYPFWQIEAGETEVLTPSYFLSPPDKTLVYQYQHADGTEGQYRVMWQQHASGVYTNSTIYADGSCDFVKYQLDNNQVVQLDSGFSVPQSEWSNEPVIAGQNTVFRQVDPGVGWSNHYQTKDAWDTLCRYQSNYTFMGWEKIVVLGQEVTAARINCREDKTIVSKSPLGAEWDQIPFAATYDRWYVDGIGLVKSSGVITFSADNQQYTVTNQLIDIIAEQ